MDNTNFSSSFQAWKSHDRDLCMSFFNAPYILDVNSGAYIKGFNRAWMTAEVNSFQKEQSNSPSEHHSSWNPSSSCCSAYSNNNNQYAPYDWHTDSFLTLKDWLSAYDVVTMDTAPINAMPWDPAKLVTHSLLNGKMTASLPSRPTTMHTLWHLGLL